MSHPRVIAIVLNFNGPELTLATVESLLGLDYPNVQVLVVDNGSTDDSAARVAEAFPEVEQILHGPNRGISSGINLGLLRGRELGADYFLTMNNDIEVDPGMLGEMVEVGQSGTVLSWSWGGQPRSQQPFDREIAWALIALDGSDTPMLHAVFVDGPTEMATGMRVRIQWREEREGHIADIAGFVPEEAG